MHKIEQIKISPSYCRYPSFLFTCHRGEGPLPQYDGPGYKAKPKLAGNCRRESVGGIFKPSRRLHQASGISFQFCFELVGGILKENRSDTMSGCGPPGHRFRPSWGWGGGQLKTGRMWAAGKKGCWLTTSEIKSWEKLPKAAFKGRSRNRFSAQENLKVFPLWYL